MVLFPRGMAGNAENSDLCAHQTEFSSAVAQQPSNETHHAQDPHSELRRRQWCSFLGVWQATRKTHPMHFQTLALLESLHFAPLLHLRHIFVQSLLHLV